VADRTDRGFAFPSDRTTLVGVLNTTPDSFSDGGRFVAPGEDVRVERVDVAGALAAAKELVASGAHVLDVGGESTRPGSTGVPAALELARTLPVIEALGESLGGDDTAISIDTRKAEVADAALRAGASIVNDVSGGLDDRALPEVAARHGATLVIGHMRGSPATMQDDPHYDDVLGEVASELASRVELALRAGVKRERIVVDPGIGFGKRLADNLALISGVAWLRERLGLPVMLGPSRKGFLGELTGDPIGERDGATHAACAVAAFLGADALRVHDVAGARRAVAVGRALAQGVELSGGRA
jgi:dihydropteroate synthase